MSELVRKRGGFLGPHSLRSYGALEVWGMLETSQREEVINFRFSKCFKISIPVPKKLFWTLKNINKIHLYQRKSTYRFSKALMKFIINTERKRNTRKTYVPVMPLNPFRSLLHR